MNDKTSFVYACLAGDCELDAIDDFIDAWHDGDSGMPLWQFLGVTRDEYGCWVVDPQVLPAILSAHRFNRPFDARMDPHVQAMR